MNYYIGLDNGGTLCKAVLFDANGQEICKASRKLRMISQHPGYTERDMEELWQANLAVLREAVATAPVDLASIKSIACSGHGKGLYLWGKNDKPVRNGIVSTDSRASSYPKMWKEDGVSDHVFAENYQNILACQPVSLLRWLKNNERDSYDAIRWIFEVKDYIRFRLTGEAYAELTDYSGSNLMNVSKKQYTKESLARFGIDEVYDALPPLRASTDICGFLKADVATAVGLNAGIPVAGGMFDIDACSIAMDIVDDTSICVIAGTWGINHFIQKSPILNKTIQMNSLYCLPGYYLIEEGSATSAGNLEWFINKFMGSEEKEKAKALGVSLYQYCDVLVESVPVQEQSIIFLPFIFGSNYNPDAKACFLGMDNHHTQAHIVRSVFEGIVFCHLVHIEKLLMNAKNIRSVRLAGGATNSTVWKQMFADVLQKPIEIVEANELGALGCAMAGAVASNEYPDLVTAAAKMTRIKETILPNAELATAYQEKFNRYKKMSEALDAFWG